MPGKKKVFFFSRDKDNEKVSILLSMIEEKTIDQAVCFENTHQKKGLSPFLQLGYKLRSPLPLSRNHARSALLTVFSITQPNLCLFPGDVSSAK
jgi:hypothetical protein